MIGLKLPPLRRSHDEAEKPFWISYADLMTALMVLFLVSVTVALFAVTQRPDEVAKQKAQREKEIMQLLSQVQEITRDFSGIVLRGHTIDLGPRAHFGTDRNDLDAAQAATVRAFVSKLLVVARAPLGNKWLKRVVVDGFADQRGTYIHNLNLSLQRAERVMCVLMASGVEGANILSDADRTMARALFLVGGSSFNDLRDTDEVNRPVFPRRL